MKRGGHLEDLGVDGRIILKMDFNEERLNDDGLSVGLLAARIC
jgi:hypothetical protein